MGCKLSYLGVRGSTFALIQNYLQNRIYSVKIGKETSSDLIVKIGVPPEVVSEIISFFVYINNIRNITNFEEHFLYYEDGTARIFTYSWEIKTKGVKK